MLHCETNMLTEPSYRLETKAACSKKKALPTHAESRKILRENKRGAKSRHNMAKMQTFARQSDRRLPQSLVKVSTGRQISW